MSQITTHYCDICGNECHGQISTVGAMDKETYSTRIEVLVRGRRHAPMDVCQECQISAIKRLKIWVDEIEVVAK